MKRRELLAALTTAGVVLPMTGWTDDDHYRSRRSTTPTLAVPTNPKAQVIVVGAGMGGATVAKFLRMWDPGIAVTLIDRAPSYTSCIMSSLVLTGQRTMSSLNFSYDTLRTRYGITVVTGEVTAIDPVAARVTMADGSVRAADRIVVAPGIAFDDVPGLAPADAKLMPHAWKAGEQTTWLASQLAAMPAGGTVVLTIPPKPYRCPPGPYERACLLADWLKMRKPGSKLIVLDANPGIVTEVENFSNAFLMLHAGVIDYRPGVRVDSVDPTTRTLFTNAGPVRGDVVNLIPRQRAPKLLADAQLVNDSAGRFAVVDSLSYASVAAPRVHVIGDSCTDAVSGAVQPKSGHIANQQAKVCADAIVRFVNGGGSPDPAPVTSSACFSTITMTQASWLHTMFSYDPSLRRMVGIAAGSGASVGWNGDHFQDMGTWFRSLMSDSFA